jgi:hypothetical protein
MRVIVAGCRDWTDAWFVGRAIVNFPWPIGEIVSGGARGADKLGERWAKENDVPLKVFPAEWSIYGKQAGFVRNAQMADYADGLIAFWDGKSRGTKDMIERATSSGLRLAVYIEPRPW